MEDELCQARKEAQQLRDQLHKTTAELAERSREVYDIDRAQTDLERDRIRFDMLLRAFAARIQVLYNIPFNRALKVMPPYPLSPSLPHPPSSTSSSSSSPTPSSPLSMQGWQSQVEGMSSKEVEALRSRKEEEVGRLSSLLAAKEAE